MKEFSEHYHEGFRRAEKPIMKLLEDQYQLSEKGLRKTLEELENPLVNLLSQAFAEGFVAGKEDK